MTTVYLHPILAACLVKAEQKLQGDIWKPSNEQQAELVRDLPDLKHLIEALPAGMLESIGSTTAGPINDFLASHNLDICLPKFGADEFGTAAVLEILAKWTVPGAKSQIHSTHSVHKAYPAVEMLPSNFAVLTTASGDEVVAPHTNGCTVLIAKAESLDAGLRLVNSTLTPSKDEFKGLRFPMVDFAAQVDIGWICGIANGDARLTHAVAQAKLRINELGAHAKAGAAIVVTYSIRGPRTLIIDKPFIIAFMVSAKVAIAFHVTQEDWKAPPSLGGRKGDTSGDIW